MLHAANDPTRQASRAWRRALERTASLGRDPFRTLPIVIDELAARFEEAPAIESRDSQLSYRSLAERSQRYARWALEGGVVKGDAVCLLLSNCPDYLAIWLGITRTGALVSLLNTHLLGDALAHAIRSVRPRRIIVGKDLVSAVEGLRSRLPADLECWVHGGDARPGFRSLEAALVGASPDPPSGGELSPPSISDPALYLHTSGTTGLPKAARISHHRLLRWSHWFAGLLEIDPGDRMYDCLPLYHGAGGIVALCATLVGGGTIVLRERFAANDFWRDVRDERCTLFHYIGELCRYLLATPRHPQESEHRVRLACGNGLQRELWQVFQTRFRVPRILEYYASTEGNFSLYNCEERPGAIGRIPPYLAHRLPVALVKVDSATAAPLRNAAGFCEKVAANEVGEAIGQILDAGRNPASRFEGYSDPEASAGKLLHDVFATGDAWYRSGDLMRRDAEGFFYFVDRLGDGYRWKGETVSSVEVAAALASCSDVVEALVYPVPVPAHEGRAGMAALVVGAGFDVARLREEISTRVPSYARPLLLRILPALELTSTLKPVKGTLAREGYDPATIRDPLYFDDRRRGAYVRLDPPLFERLRTGGLRV